jgi:hypothetical protein
MQQTGIETIQHVATSLGGLGRYGDTYIVHAAEGETVVPLEVLDHDPLLKERLFNSMRAMGIEPDRYIVGNELNSKNPITGQPEFFFKQIKKIFKSPIAQVAAGMFLPGSWGMLAAPAMEAIAGGESKDILNALARGTAGKGFADFSGITGAGDKMFFKDSGVSGDWWDTLKKQVWNKGGKLDSKGLAKALTDGSATAKKLGLTEGTQEYSQFMTGIYDTFMKSGIDKGGIINQLGGRIMEDPLKALFTGGMAWGQYDEAKRYNEAMKRQAESGSSYDYTVTDDVVENIFSDAPLVTAAKGGGISKIFPHKDGGISGPGTGTSDDIPAMLSDGEFVMTANAVKGAGGGSRSAGTKKMYDMMRQFEGKS